MYVLSDPAPRIDSEDLKFYCSLVIEKVKRVDKSVHVEVEKKDTLGLVISPNSNGIEKKLVAEWVQVKGSERRVFMHPNHAPWQVQPKNPMEDEDLAEHRMFLEKTLRPRVMNEILMFVSQTYGLQAVDKIEMRQLLNYLDPTMKPPDVQYYGWTGDRPNDGIVGGPESKWGFSLPSGLQLQYKKPVSEPERDVCARLGGEEVLEFTRPGGRNGVSELLKGVNGDGIIKGYTDDLRGSGILSRGLRSYSPGRAQLVVVRLRSFVCRPLLHPL